MFVKRVILFSALLHYCCALFTEPIDEKIFSSSSLPTDPYSKISQEVLLNTNKYCLNKWWDKAFRNQTQKYLDFHGIDEYQIRWPAMEAMALAIAIKTKAYNKTYTGKTSEEALNITTRLLSSLAYKHRANSAGGWGNQWESALWASHVSLGAWLIWDHLSEVDRHLVENLTLFEANRFNKYVVPYYQNKEGKVITPGDTKAEENAWNANAVQMAVAMMPTHPNHKVWSHKNIELLISSYSRRSDLNNTEVLHGKQVKEWLNGSNVFENGTLVNHNRFHPDYMTDIYCNLQMILTQALAKKPVPKATFFNLKLMYGGFVNLHWPSPPYPKSGGPIYLRDSSGKPSNNIYYPQGDDWGNKRRIHFAYLDNYVNRFTDFGQHMNASEWSMVHMEAQLHMQHRFTDGHTYGDHAEDTYARREEWVACIAAYNYLATWVKHNINYTLTNESVF